MHKDRLNKDYLQYQNVCNSNVAEFSQPWVRICSYTNKKRNAHCEYLTEFIYRKNWSGRSWSVHYSAAVKSLSLEEKLGLPARPKKPLSPYLQFCKQKFNVLSQMNPKSSFKGFFLNTYFSF